MLEIVYCQEVGKSSHMPVEKEKCAHSPSQSQSLQTYTTGESRAAIALAYVGMVSIEPDYDSRWEGVHRA